MKKMLADLFRTFTAPGASVSLGDGLVAGFTKEDPKLVQRRTEAKERLKDNIQAGQAKQWTLAPTVLGVGQPAAQ